MIPQLSAEICLMIFQHLRFFPITHPTPADVPAQGLQEDLLSCSRVSKLWHSLASPLLYRVAIVRSLPRFIRGLDESPVEGVVSKKYLLGKVERLFVDMSPASVDSADISEEDLKAYSEEVNEEDLEKCREEMRQMKAAEELLTAWKTILERPDPTEQIFTRVRTVSTNAITGAHRVVPWPPASRSARWATLLEECQDALSDFIEKTRSVRHFCGTGGPGPLSLDPDTYFIGSGKAGRTMSNHSSISDPVLRPACIGMRTKWFIHEYDEFPPHEGHEDKIVIDEAKALIAAMAQNRRDTAVDSKWDKEGTNWDITGALYIGVPSGEAGVDVETQKERVRGIARSFQGKMDEVVVEAKTGLPKEIKVADRIEVKSLIDSACEACEWNGANATHPPGFYEMVCESLHMM